MIWCGICCSKDAVETCAECSVYICDDCKLFVNLRGCDLYIKVCQLCHKLAKNDPMNGDYCKMCDTHVISDDFIYYKSRCKKCDISKKTLANRALLPHIKTKVIIKHHVIPDVAQLIFDYYYEPRRYFEGEI